MKQDGALVQAVLDLVAGSSEAVKENSNKNAQIIPTQRDLVAGEVSKYVARTQILPEDLVKAHDSGEIHIHDLDYFLSPGMINCCLPNYADMLTRGTVINGAEVSSPKSFQVACTVFTQIVAQIASAQYGGQSADRFPDILAPFLRRTFVREQKEIAKELAVSGVHVDDDLVTRLATHRMKIELKNGIQTIQYQLNTLMTTNGQSPFVTLTLHFDPESEYAHEAAMITEEVLRQRIQGVKNHAGVPTTPVFPKLIYVLDEYNIHPNSPYYYLTELAAQSTALRMYPDYISAKKMRETYNGQVFAPMGCRSFLPYWQRSDGTPQFVGRFNKGVVSLNLPMVALDAGCDRDAFFKLLDERLEMVHRALLIRQQSVEQGSTNSSPIHWVCGGLARLPLGEKIPSYYLEGGYSTLSIGYIGICETTWAITGESNTTEGGKAFAHEVLDYINMKREQWNKQRDLGFSVYGTPAESLTHKFARALRARHGVVEHVSDRPFITNSYHVHVEEPIDIFSKFTFESEFQPKSMGGCISYAEIGSVPTSDSVLVCLQHNYKTLMYGEFNGTNSDYCSLCGSTDAAQWIEEDEQWECVNCGNRDESSLSVIRRTCGYLGSNRWLSGRSEEIEHFSKVT